MILKEDFFYQHGEFCYIKRMNVDGISDRENNTHKTQGQDVEESFQRPIDLTDQSGKIRKFK